MAFVGVAFLAYEPVFLGKLPAADKAEPFRVMLLWPALGHRIPQTSCRFPA